MTIFEKIRQINIVDKYRKMYPFIRPYKWVALFSLLVTIPLGSMDALIAWVLRPYTNVVIVEKNLSVAWQIPLLIVLFTLFNGLLNFAYTWLNAWVSGKINMELRETLYERLTGFEAAYFDNNSSGNILVRFNQDVDSACAGLLVNLKVFSTRLFSSIALIGVLVYNSWQLAIVAVAVLFGALYPLTRVRKRLNGIVNKSLLSQCSVITYYNESFHGNRVVTSYNLHDYQRKRFREALQSVFDLGMKLAVRTGLVSPVMHFLTSLGLAGAIWYGSHLVLSGQISAGQFVSFIVALLLLYQPVKSLGSTFTNMQVAFMAMERVFELLERKPGIADREDAVELPAEITGIRFENLYFEYLPGQPVLNNIDLEIAPGQSVALVGASGGGKTTLSNLLPRFYEAGSGAVRINGRDVREYTLRSLRERIAIVFQDNFLFAGTLRENILLGREVSEERLRRILADACLEEFVSGLPVGLETEIGERGVTLSGGQRQRVAIARAFVKDAPIVILDEATSALDNKSEEVIRQAIGNLMVDRTVIIIAHRLSTVKDCDRIVVIHNGTVAESGAHQELLAREGGVYSSLYRTQLV